MDVPIDMQTEIEDMRRSFDVRARDLIISFQSGVKHETEQGIKNAYFGVVYGILIGRSYMEVALRESTVQEFARRIGVVVPDEFKKSIYQQSTIPPTMNQVVAENPLPIAYEKGSDIIRRASDDHLRRDIEYVTRLKMCEEKQSA